MTRSDRAVEQDQKTANQIAGDLLQPKPDTHAECTADNRHSGQIQTGGAQCENHSEANKAVADEKIVTLRYAETHTELIAEQHPRYKTTRRSISV